MGLYLYTFINILFTTLSFLIVARVILSWFPKYRYQPIGEMIHSLTDPILAPIQRFIPRMGMFDFSPMIAILLLNVLQQVLAITIQSVFGPP